MTHRPLSILVLAAATLCVRAQPLYPTVAKAEQVERDKDRRLILETELAAEHEALMKSKTAFENSPTRDREIEVRRHEENIRASQRELESATGNDAARNPKRVLVKAQRPATGAGNTKDVGRFWDPYNRAPDTTDFSTSPRRDSHE
jgi:hypothetical protein